MATANNSDADSSAPNVDTEDVRDLFEEEDPLDPETISEQLEIPTEDAEDHLNRLVQSGIVEKNARRAISGGSNWELKYPQLRLRTRAEIANESPLTQKAEFDGEPRDDEVAIEDVLDLLAEYESNRADLSTARIAVHFQITPRHARDLADDLVERGVAEKRAEPSGSDQFWLAEGFSADDVEAVIGDPEPEIEPSEN